MWTADATHLDTSHAACAAYRCGHLRELVLFSFVVEGMGLRDAEDRLSIGQAIANIAFKSVVGPGRAAHIEIQYEISPFNYERTFFAR